MCPKLAGVRAGATARHLLAQGIGEQAPKRAGLERLRRHGDDQHTDSSQRMGLGGAGYRREHEVNQTMANKLPAAHPEKLPSAIPASSTVFQQLPKSCPTVVQQFLWEPGFVPCSANIAPIWAYFEQRLGNFGQH